MILAAPLVIPFAKAVGLSVGKLGMAAIADQVNDYIEANPEESAMILKTLVPNLGIGEIFMKKGKDEEALDGFDVELGAHLPYIPSMKAYLKAFDFEVSGGNDFQGLEFSTQIKVPNSGLSFEIGHTDFDHHNDQSFINLKYSNSIKNPGTSLFTSEAFERISMKDRMYEKVRRENVIKKKGTGFTVKAGGF